MKKIKIISVIVLLSAFSSLSLANCCKGMGGIQYCDSSAGRLVCKNGYYSSCYCTNHAVMDLQKLSGCCLWHGGILNQDAESGLVICNDGSISAVCSTQGCMDKQSIGNW